VIPIFFKNQSEFREWLEKNHKKETELLVGFYKIASSKHNMTWPQSVDEALCFGWIDSVRKSIDHESYCIRFTPRKPTSIWSKVNIDKVKKLTKSGLMQPSGIEAYQNRKAEKSEIYSFESDTKLLAGHLEKQFTANKKAWEFFITRSPSYQKTVIHWIMTAKQEATKLSRLEKTILASEKQKLLWDRYK
jgi:uncharacterized protein YdeI (YjbR/CyaY-like superfamily)